VKIFLGITLLSLFINLGAIGNEIKLTCMADNKSATTEISLYPELKQALLYCLSCSGDSKADLVISDNRYDLYWNVTEELHATFTINRVTGRYNSKWEGENIETNISPGTCVKSTANF